jgi:hypothetical protein
MSQNNLNLPIKTGDDFVGELETMDLSSLKDKQFLVAVNQGERSSVKFVCSTIRGPFTFEEMVETVGVMWKIHQHHGKAIILEKDIYAAPKFLDENTIDYIEAHYEDIITESMLDGIFDGEKQYTCRANILEGNLDENPLNASSSKEENDEDIL